MAEMKFELLQILDIGKAIYSFCSYEFAEAHGLSANDYTKMYEGTISDSGMEGESTAGKEREAAEMLFTEFNTRKPADYYGRSLSVSDVLVFGSGNAYYCDTYGWVQLDSSFYEAWQNAPMIVCMEREQRAAAHIAQFAAAKICGEFCQAGYACSIKHNPKSNCEATCPLERCLEGKQRIREWMRGSNSELSEKDRNAICVNCEHTTLSVEQGQIVLLMPEDGICKNCPVKQTS